jgi:CBS domain containing-hemolysin-like protein
MPVLEILVVPALLNSYFAMSELAAVSARLQARARAVVDMDGRRIDKVLVRPSVERESNSAFETVSTP